MLKTLKNTFCYGDEAEDVLLGDSRALPIENKAIMVSYTGLLGLHIRYAAPLPP